MKPETNASLSVLPIRLIEVHFEKSTKSKALNAAMAALGDDYDIALVLDADNVIPYDYLNDVNDLYACLLYTSSSVITDCLEHTARQQGDNDELAHSCDARSHRSEPVEEVHPRT